MKAIDLIKKWESCRLTAYQDITGVWTIGWGHTKGVKPGEVITQAQADSYLQQDISWAIQAVDNYESTYQWTNNERAALISFSYNLGFSSISQVTANGTRSKSEIAEKMLLYYNAGGKKVQGLVNRRKEEHDLFLTPDSDEEDSDLNSAKDLLSQAIGLLLEAVEILGEL